VLHVGECGLSSAPDGAILDFARRHQYSVCTLDADFHALLALSGAAAPSVIRIRREGLTASGVADLLQAIRPKVQAALERGAVISVTDEALRFRYLPVGMAN
jgi:predicted nuclease of predicted toxin-antitoxin system